MKSRGFTIIELLVVIIVMAILLTLAVVNVRSTQTQARDNERHVDVENIATTLETFYTSVHRFESTIWKETYPGSYEMSNPTTYMSEFIRERTPNESFYAPKADVGGTWSLTMATNNDQTPTGVRPIPTTSTYVYQPLSIPATGAPTLCTMFIGHGCKKFNIFYKLERPTDECPPPDNICIIRSRH